MIDYFYHELTAEEIAHPQREGFCREHDFAPGWYVDDWCEESGIAAETELDHLQDHLED